MTDPLGQSQVIPYVKGLSKKGYQFILMSYEKRDRFKNFGNVIREHLEEDRITWKPFRYHKKFSVIATLYDLFIGFFFLLFFIPKNKVKLIHCRSYISSILGLLFKRIYGTKFIFDMRGFWADERIEGGIFKSKLLYKFFKWLEKLFLLNADATISLTRNAVDEMRNWKYMKENDLEKIHHITTCCNIDLYAPVLKRRLEKNIDFSKLTFVYVGSIGPWHSFEKIKSFVKTVYFHFPMSKFKMIINWGMEEFIDHIKEEKYDESRFIIDSLPHNQIPSALLDTDIGFFFIPPVYAKKSSSPTKLGELLAAGIPVITGHSIGDVDYLVENNKIGYIVKNFTEEEYLMGVNYIIQLLKQDKEKLASRCLDVANDYFSLNKGVEKYSLIYESILR